MYLKVSIPDTTFDLIHSHMVLVLKLYVRPVKSKQIIYYSFVEMVFIHFRNRFHIAFVTYLYFTGCPMSF